MPNVRTVVVTGANRGIGLAICKNIMGNPLLGPLKLLATSRKGQDLGLVTHDGDEKSVMYPKLDISSVESIRHFTDEVSSQCGSVDVLINNAGVNLDFERDEHGPKETLDVNYRGTLLMCQSFLPILHSSEDRSADPLHSPPSTSRIVNLSSVASSLKPYTDEIAQRFRTIAAEGSLDTLEDLAQEYESTSPSASFAEPPSRAYSVSKACVNALTAILARQNPSVLINACCPGWIATDMGALIGQRRPPKTPDEGAEVPLHLAFGDLRGVSGRYWANESVRSKGLPRVREW